jgi:hypothetical protein
MYRNHAARLRHIDLFSPGLDLLKIKLVWQVAME